MMLHICYALNEGYLPYCLASIASVLHNNTDSSFHFHILTDSMSAYAQTQAHECVTQWGGTDVTFHFVDNSLLEGQNLEWSPYGWYRIFCGDLLSPDINQVLYLDCDVIVCGSIKELWKIDYSEKSLAGVPDLMTVHADLYSRIGYPMTKGYFCSGVLMLNLDFFRRHKLSQEILKYAINNPERINFPDQDALNIVCKDTKELLPLKYGILAPFFTDRKFIAKYKKEVKECLDDPRIIHYAGCNPWIIENSPHYYEDEFWKYAAMVPGGIRRRHCCHGYGLVSLTAKRILGKLGMKSFKRFIPSPRPTYEQITKLLEL